MADITLYNNAQELVTTAPTIDSLIEMFLQSNDVRESSKDQYRKSIKPFFIWIEKKGYRLSDITRINIIQFKDELLTGGRSSATINSYLTAVRKFYDFVETIKLYPNVARGIKGAKSKKQFRKQPLSELQGKSLVSHVEEGANLRDTAIINLLLRTGLRTIEVIRANVEDLTFKGDKRVLLIQGKGRDEKDSFVKLSDKAYAPIDKYLKSRTPKAGEPLFSCSSNRNKAGRLTTRSISRIAKNNLKEIGIDSREFTAHSLRHTAAVNTLRHGGTLGNVQEMLRHANPATTQIYTLTMVEESRMKHSAEDILDAAY